MLDFDRELQGKKFVIACLLLRSEEHVSMVRLTL